MRRVENCMQQLIGNCCRLSSIRLYREWIFCCCYFNWKPTKIGYNFFYIHFTSLFISAFSHTSPTVKHTCVTIPSEHFISTPLLLLELVLLMNKKLYDKTKELPSLSHNACGCCSFSSTNRMSRREKKSVRELNQIWHATKENRAIHSNFVLITQPPMFYENSQFATHKLTFIYTHTHSFKNHLQLLCPACIFAS